MTPGLSPVTVTATASQTEIRLDWTASKILQATHGAVTLLMPKLKASATVPSSQRSLLINSINTNLSAAIRSTSNVQVQAYLSDSLSDMQQVPNVSDAVALALIGQAQSHVTSAQRVPNLSKSLKTALTTIQNQLVALRATY